ncbi:MAG: phospholipase/Carboxylesterase [Solirubrobacteraceae bacterium]|nr:phospholipase/Carboxylesterase [Solirubrobacteraceae bacterium]
MIHLVREAAGAPAGTIVLLHGRGADEHDLLPLLGVLDPKRRLRGITVGAPLTMPPGGKHWYAVHRVGFPDPATFAPTYAELTGFLDEELGLDWSQTVIGGFSQGGVMSYAVGLGPGRPVPAGVLAMSSFIPRLDDDSWEPDFATRPQLPVAHVHGAADPVIGIEFGRDARDRVTAAGLPLLYREFPGGHHVDPRLLSELASWLSERL